MRREASELDKRPRELISDYAALFLRYPHVDGQGASTEAHEKARVLAALRVHPWRKPLATQASKFERESLQAAGVALGQKENWWERWWIESIPAILERRKWDVDLAARDLITTMPASFRLLCPGYPGCDDPDAFDAAAVAVASRIQNAVKDSKRCKDPNAKAIGRLALVAMGYKTARSHRQIRARETQQD